MSKQTAKNTKRNVLDYGMEWFDYHLTAGLYISVIISLLLFILVFLGQFYRPEIYATYPILKIVDAVMSVYYLVYTLVVFFTRKIFFEEDKRSFGLFLILFFIRAVFHGLLVFALTVLARGVLEVSIFYKYIFYFAVAVTAVNIFNIWYFIRRKGIFEFE